jgi:hypothetical protein
MPSVRYLPIDGLIASLDDALAEIREIETRRGSGTWAGLAGPTTAGALEQQQRLRDAKDYLLRAQALVYAYAKGPTA